MKIELNEALAKRFLQKIGRYTDYNVNIMDVNGNIIAASRNVERIGTFHEVAYRMVEGNVESMVICKKNEYEGVKEGVNLLNGNQVVGYCRVRKVATVGGANNDFGRTLRQRRVLTAIFEGYKSKGIGELLGLMNTLLPYVTTDLTAKQMENLLVDFIEEQITEIESLRIPAEGAYVGRTVEGAGSVLDPDLEANIQIMYEFIFGDESEEEETTAAE